MLHSCCVDTWQGCVCFVAYTRATHYNDCGCVEDVLSMPQTCFSHYCKCYYKLSQLFDYTNEDLLCMFNCLKCCNIFASDLRENVAMSCTSIENNVAWEVPFCNDWTV